MIGRVDRPMRTGAAGYDANRRRLIRLKVARQLKHHIVSCEKRFKLAH
jgi:hypothetical protein